MTRQVTITIPDSVLDKIDEDRKDVKRSTYICRILERQIARKETEQQ